MTTFINDAIGLVLMGVGLLLTFLLLRLNRRPAGSRFAVSDMPTLIGQTWAVGLFAVGLGVFLHSTF